MKRIVIGSVLVLALAGCTVESDPPASVVTEIETTITTEVPETTTTAEAITTTTEFTTTTTEAPTTTTQPELDAREVDAYWSQDGDTFYLVLEGLADYTYCQVDLTLGSRRVGEWTNALPEGRDRVTFEWFLPESLDMKPDFDGYEIECTR